MFARCQDARKALLRPLRWLSAAQVRTAASSRPSAAMLQVTNSVAEQLESTGLWTPTRGRKKANQASPGGDKHRVNIVSDGLCDDILKYIGPSLERHRGCDLVDINPGAGIWSRKLHEVLEPRKHVMMEKDAALYQPFLADLLAKDNVELVPKSGILWKDLSEMLRNHLPNQTPLEEGAMPQRNDTLLVNVNLAMFPRKPFQQFECVSTMVLYQFMASIRTGALFQKYGLIRMLIWVNDDGKRRLLPRSIVRRRRSAFEAELTCEWIHEIAGKDVEVESRNELRDEWINRESGYRTLERMKKQGLTMPAGRETKMYLDLMADQSLAGQQLAGTRRPNLRRPFKHEMEELEEEFKASKSKVVPTRLKELRLRDKYDVEDGLNYLQLLQERDVAIALAQASSPEASAADKAWNDKLDSFKKNPRNEFIILRDNYHVFRQDPPALFWDRRPFEPLNVTPEEFYPNSPCALLDFQPKVMHPLLREQGNDSSRAGDISDLMLRYWFAHSLLPASKAMDGIWPGFGDLFWHCPSLRDARRGGAPLTGCGEVVSRTVNEGQWTEILEAFMRWPFRPSYAQLVGRLVEDHEQDAADEEETKSGAMGVTQ